MTRSQRNHSEMCEEKPVTNAMVKGSILSVVLFLNNCSPGWSVAGYDLNPQDSTKTNTVFTEIISQPDSLTHWYHPKIHHGDNWCYKHDTWENVKIIPGVVDE